MSKIRSGKFFVMVFAISVVPGCSWFSSAEKADDSNGTKTEVIETHNGTIIDVTSKSDFDGYIKTKKNVVADFSATWCPPCRRMHPINEELAKEYADVTFLVINIDQARDLASSQEVQGVPTFLFFNDGRLVERNVGAMDKETYKGKLKKHFGL